MKSCLLIILSLLSLSTLGQSLIWQSLGEPGDGGAVTSIRVSPFNSNHILLGGDIMGSAYSLNGGLNWQDSYGFNDWSIGDFTWHPSASNIVWAGTMSGPFKSTDGGKHWQMMRNGMPPISNWYYTCPIQKILFDPSNENHLFAFGGSFRFWPSQGTPKWNAVWESTDGGNNWSQLTTIGNVLSPGILNAIYIGSAKIVTAVYGQGIYISTDNGATWNVSNTGLSNNNVTWVTADPANSSVLYCSTKNYLSASTYLPGGIFKSTDGGATWSNISNGLEQTSDSDTRMASYYRMVKVSPTNSNVLYTANGGWLNSMTYKSTDGGLSWNALFSTAPAINTSVFYNFSGPELYVFDFDPNDGNTLIGGNWEYVLKTTDGGVNWDDMMSNPTSISGYFTGTGYSGIAAVNFEFNPYNANEAVFQGMDDAKFVISKDNLNSWKRGGIGMSRMNGGTDLTFAGINGTTIYCTTGQDLRFDGVWKSIDGGDNWTNSDHTSFSGCTATGGQPLGVYALPNNPDISWVSVQDKIYQTTDGGSVWVEVFAAVGMSTITVSKNNPYTFYVNSQKGVYKTTDGINFLLMPGSPKDGRNILVDPNNDSVLFVVKYKTNDGEEGLWKYDGNSWALLRHDFNLFNVAVQPGNSQIILVVTHDEPFHDVMASTGVWLSTDGGTNWIQENFGLPILRGNSITFNPHQPNQVIIGLAGRGFYKTDISQILAINSFESGIISKIKIYPNPTRGDITISFILDKPSSVEMNLFNIDGKKIKELFKQEVSSGKQNINFSTDRLARGVYFVQIIINGYGSIKKIIIN
ncbi:MAG: T9SS type A sorting domain-containing protein [Flavobacteriaceae bacterium]|nr:T9SS type A sorting domain-containing protein [Flavobacteriaceae bacterium]